jgi:DMSO/TMAO reductase YedYZ molybdopterin-dependent catalytic subunit
VLRRLGGPDRNVALVVPQRPARVPTRPPFPRVPGLSPEITSPEDHYTVDVNLVAPSVDASSWELTVGGEVDRPLRLSFEGLQRRFEVVEEFSALACVSNEVGGDLVGHSRWGGVRLRDVLRAAGISAGASDIVLRGADNYSDSIPTDVAMDPHVLIAVSQNGEPLTQEHGFPCRVRVPPIYGMKNVKWLTSIEVVGGDHQGYWQRRGWSDTAEVKTQSRIDVAGSDGDAALGAETWIAGVAWAGDRGISKVDVSVDGGSTWQAADLKAPIAESSWRLWAYRWTPDRRGEVSVVCRATDGRGRVQTSRRVPPHPDGASGLHEVRVTVV